MSRRPRIVPAHSWNAWSPEGHAVLAPLRAWGIVSYPGGGLPPFCAILRGGGACFAEGRIFQEVEMDEQQETVLLAWARDADGGYHLFTGDGIYDRVGRWCLW